jgi:hypothetical protein
MGRVRVHTDPERGCSPTTYTPVRPRLPTRILVPLLALLVIEAAAFAAWAIQLSPTPPTPQPAHPDMSWADSLSRWFDQFIPALQVALTTWAAVTVISGMGVWRGWRWTWYLAFALQMPLVAVLGAIAVAALAAADRQLPIIAYSLLIFAVPMGIVVLLFQRTTLEHIGIHVFSPS